MRLPAVSIRSRAVSAASVKAYHWRKPRDAWWLLKRERQGGSQVLLERAKVEATAGADREAAADRERLNIDNLLRRLRNWAEDAARDYMADNPDVDLQDIAYDLADAWEFEFDEDEREELMWHFDGDLNDLKIYAAESMG